jgi:hypothetical protein
MINFQRIDIDLNDRIAFVKTSFGNNNEDYNRVLNQLITLTISMKQKISLMKW